MNCISNLTNHFLIAMPGLADPHFFQTVAYICEHNENGAMGLIVNKPVDLDFNELLTQLEIKPKIPINNQTLLSGGPVSINTGFILHKPLGNWESTLPITTDVGLTSSRDIIQAIANGQGPEHALITLGYAGWSAGQLEEEISNNTWLTHPADIDVIFDTAPEQLWSIAAQLMGIDIALLSNDTGHA